MSQPGRQGQQARMLPGCRHIASNPVCREESEGTRQKGSSSLPRVGKPQRGVGEGTVLESEERKPKNTEGAEGVNTPGGGGGL